jgi:Lhr-like helicase
VTVKKDIGKRDIEELARVLGVRLPSRWTVRAGWVMCMEKAKRLRQPELPHTRDCLSTTQERLQLVAEASRAARMVQHPPDGDRIAATLNWIEESST